MVRIGEVVEKTGDVLSVVFERPEACTHCSGCDMKQHCTRIDIRGEAEVGDTIEVDMPEKNVLGATAIAYIVPLAALIAGLLLGVALHGPLSIAMNSNLFCALTGIAAFAVGLLVVWMIDKSLRGKQGWEPRVVTVHKKKAE